MVPQLHTLPVGRVAKSKQQLFVSFQAVALFHLPPGEEAVRSDIELAQCLVVGKDFAPVIGTEQLHNHWSFAARFEGAYACS